MMILQPYIKKRFLKYSDSSLLFDELKVQDNLSVAGIHTEQMKKLKHLMRTSFLGTDRYKQFAWMGYVDELNYEDFKKIPVLTKDIIRTEANTLINTGFDITTENVSENSSGGSTGAPVIFWQTKKQRDHTFANYRYALYLNGVDFYDKTADLWGAVRDMHGMGKRGIRNRIKDYILNMRTFNTFILSDIIIGQYIKDLNNFKPKFIKAYVHSIYEIAKFINDRQIKIEFSPIIHTTTGPLYSEMRSEIERAFHTAKVYSFYGSREVGAIAHEVIGKDGMYVMADNVFVEILDIDGNPVAEGEEGEIVITTLNNYYMPLIRYKIGDRAIKADELFGTLKMDKVLGRTLGVIRKMDGTHIDGEYFTTLFFGVRSVEQFQMVQKSLDYIELRIIKSKFFSQGEIDDVVTKIENEIPGVKVNLIYNSKIDLSATGKKMYVYSEIEM